MSGLPTVLVPSALLGHALISQARTRARCVRDRGRRERAESVLEEREDVALARERVGAAERDQLISEAPVETEERNQVRLPDGFLVGETMEQVRTEAARDDVTRELERDLADVAAIGRNTRVLSLRYSMLRSVAHDAMKLGELQRVEHALPACRSSC